MSNSRTRIIVVGILALAVGCATEPGITSQGDVPEVSPEVRALHLPFERYELSQIDRQTIAYAEDLLTGACMRSRGLEWVTLPPPPDQDPDPLIRRRYGIVEPEIAARYGYHLPPLSPELSARETVLRQRDRLPVAERHMAYGVDGAGGCRATARDQLRTGVSGLDENRLYNHAAEAFRASQIAPEVTAVFGAWSTCMAAAGFHYTDPLQAIADADLRPAQPSSREIAIATADVRCKQDSDLVAVWSGVEARLQRDAIRSYPEDFEAFARAKDALLDAARLVIEHGPAR